MSKYDAPPSYPPQAHYDAGPAYPPQGAPGPSPSPYNEYGGFNHAPSQAHLDPRDGNKYGSPAPGGYMSPAPQGYYGPPAGYQQQQQGYYGNQGGMNYGPPQGGYPQQGYHQPNQQYYQERRSKDGICTGIFAALACCCCLDFIF